MHDFATSSWHYPTLYFTRPWIAILPDFGFGFYGCGLRYFLVQVFCFVSERNRGRQSNGSAEEHKLIERRNRARAAAFLNPSGQS